MTEIWMDLNEDVDAPANLMPLISSVDFLTRMDAVAFNASGMDVVWNFTTPDGVTTQTAVVLSDSGNYKWTHLGDAMYTISIPASGGTSINNDTEGFGWFTGIADGILVWRSPLMGFIDNAPAGVTEALIRSVISMLQYNPSIRKNVRNDTIEIKRAADADFDIRGLGDLAGRTKLYFTVKKMTEKDDVADTQSIIQIEEGAGLIRINKNSATSANGSLTVTNELAGNINITLEASETAKIEPNITYLYDIKKDNLILGEGRFMVSTAITRTLT